MNLHAGLGRYNSVAYFIDGKPVRVSGYHVMEHEGVTMQLPNKNVRSCLQKTRQV